MLQFLPSPYLQASIRDRTVVAAAGDDIEFAVSAELAEGPAVPGNSIIEAAVSDTRFSPTPWWTGCWRAGVEALTDAGAPGLAKITLPRELTESLRRGSYTVSVRLSDRLRRAVKTVASGNITIEYEPTSPHRNIFYRDRMTCVESASTIRPPAPQQRIRAFTVDVAEAAESLDITLSPRQNLAAAPMLLSPNGQVPNTWLTNVVRDTGSATVFFSSPIPTPGWRVSYIVIEVT